MVELYNFAYNYYPRGGETMLGIIRVLTSEDPKILQEHSALLKETHNISSISKCIPDQPNGIHDEKTEKLAIPKIKKLVKELVEEDHVDAVTISCAADPAVDSSRDLVDVPVLGAGRAGAILAATLGEKVGVIGITPKVPDTIKNVLGDRLIGHRQPKGVNKTTDLFADDFFERAEQASRELIEEGADVIQFACTGFSTVHLKDHLREVLDIPIVDLVEAQGVAYQLITT